MKNISAWAIRHPLPPIVLFVVLLFMGLVAFLRLPVTADPDVAFPMVTVGVEQPGAAPQEMETRHIDENSLIAAVMIRALVGRDCPDLTLTARVARSSRCTALNTGRCGRVRR